MLTAGLVAVLLEEGGQGGQLDVRGVDLRCAGAVEVMGSVLVVLEAISATGMLLEGTGVQIRAEKGLESDSS